MSKLAQKKNSQIVHITHISTLYFISNIAEIYSTNKNRFYPRIVNMITLVISKEYFVSKWNFNFLSKYCLLFHFFYIFIWCLISLSIYFIAALKTQPYDLLRWSAAYFRCLSDDELPPVKVRYEMTSSEATLNIENNVFGCLTRGYLKVLMNQVRKCERDTITKVKRGQKVNNKANVEGKCENVVSCKLMLMKCIDTLPKIRLQFIWNSNHIQFRSIFPLKNLKQP